MDLKIVEAVQNISTPFLDWLFSALTRFGEEIFFVCVFLIFYWCLSYNHAFKFAFCYVASVMLNGVLKLIVRRPRPWMASSSIENKLPASGLSFPSGHSQSISAISTFIVYDVFTNKQNSKKVKLCSLIVAILICLTVGFTRIYLGQHYLTDVLAGLLLGALVVLLIKFIEAKLPDKFKQKINLQLVLTCVSIVMLIAVIVVGFFEIGLSYSATIKVFRYAGMAVGVTLGYLLSLKCVLNIELTKLQKLLKVAIGFVVTFGTYLLLSLIPVGAPFMIAFNVLISAIIATFVYPWLFNKIILKLKKD